jgi:signal transduction histidine kinase
MALHLPIYDKHLLIVDDNTTNIILMQAILEEEGFTNIHSASCVMETYDILENEPINLILMDIMMPDIDGLEALEAIKTNDKFSQIDVIMVTATDDDDTLKKSFELGAVDFVRKPVNQVELIARLRTTLQSQEKDTMILQHSRFDAMEEIIGMLAHQWRQPLSIINAIVGTIVVQKELNMLSDEELASSLEGINKHTHDLSHMITTFREFFKTDASPTLSSPNEAIHEACELMHEGLEQQHIRLDIDLSDLKPMFYTQNLLAQVLTNLITNSREAFLHNKISEPYISVSSFVQNNKVNILVKDNAGGFPAQIQKNIFEPYFTTKSERNGKGLGLFFAKNIISQHFKGNIYAKSQDGKSEFLITFAQS